MSEGLVDGAAFAVEAGLIALMPTHSLRSQDQRGWEGLARTRRSVREYLDTLDEATWGVAKETLPKFISRLDPTAQLTALTRGMPSFAYADNNMIELKAAIIVDFKATRAICQAEVAQHAR
jgi:hypothetical protein